MNPGPDEEDRCAVAVVSGLAARDAVRLLARLEQLRTEGPLGGAQRTSDGQPRSSASLLDGGAYVKGFAAGVEAAARALRDAVDPAEDDEPTRPGASSALRGSPG